MEFDDMKRIWNETSQAYQYVIDEQHLENNIKNRSRRIGSYVRRMEWFLIVVNALTAVVLLIVAKDEPGTEYLLYGIAVALICMGTYILYLRRVRLQKHTLTPLSMLDDLDRAIQNAAHMERLSLMMLVYAVPLLSAMWMVSYLGEESTEWLIGFSVFILIILVAARWEHRHIHARRKNKLIRMRDQLTERT